MNELRTALGGLLALVLLEGCALPADPPGALSNGYHPDPLSGAADAGAIAPPAPQVCDEACRCRVPAAGCTCADASAPVACNVLTDTTAPGPGGACLTGQRICRDGAWSRCQLRPDATRVVLPPSDCPGDCTPGCRHEVDCPEPGDTLPAGTTGTAFAQVAPAPFCPAGTQPGGLTGDCRTSPPPRYVRGPTGATWLDACAAPGHRTVLAGVDDGTATDTLPFSFPYFGVPRSSVVISSNGLLAFGGATYTWVNRPLPVDSATDAVFAFWEDLVERDGTCLATFGAAPDRRYVVEWNDLALAHWLQHDPSHLSFEIILSESTGDIDVLYGTLQGDDPRAQGSSATIGLQKGTGSWFDQVSFNTPDAVSSGRSFRWAPLAGSTTCAPAVYDRTFQAACDPDGQGLVPVWGILSYTSSVPPGTAIRLEARAARRLADLATAPVVRLPDAPAGTALQSTTLDLGAILRAARPLQEMLPWVRLTAYLVPDDDGATAPTLGAVELRSTCVSNEELYSCLPGSGCHVDAPCRTGTIRCTNTVPACVPAGVVAAGTPCGPPAIGYVRAPSPQPWLEACAAPAHTVLLAGTDDATADDLLPFAFPFFGVARTAVTLSANGLLAFQLADSERINQPLPAPGEADAVFAFWDDLGQRTGICTATFGAAPARRYVVEWSDAFVGPDPTDRHHLTFEVILSEDSRAIDVLYGSMIGPGARRTGSSATIGLQRDTGSWYDLVGYDTAGVVGTGTALRWTPAVRARCDGAGSCVP